MVLFVLWFSVCEMQTLVDALLGSACTWQGYLNANPKSGLSSPPVSTHHVHSEGREGWCGLGFVLPPLLSPHHPAGIPCAQVGSAPSLPGSKPPDAWLSPASEGQWPPSGLIPPSQEPVPVSGPGLHHRSPEGSAVFVDLQTAQHPHNMEVPGQGHIPQLNLMTGVWGDCVARTPRLLPASPPF